VKILHLATTYPLFEGDSNAVFVENLAEALAARGHEIHVLIPWHPDLQLERAHRSAHLHAFRYSPLPRWHPWGYAQALTADKALRWDAYLAAAPAALASGLGVRRILRTTPIDIVNTHWILPNGPITALALVGKECPNVISCHGSGVFLAERHGWARAAARWALKRCAKVTACSQDLARRAEGLGQGPGVEWVPYGVDTAKFGALDMEGSLAARRAIAARHGLDPEGRWILAVGRLVFKKGFDGLVAALPAVRRTVPNAEVLIVGEGPLQGSLRQQAQQAGVGDALHLLGPLPHTLLPDYYAAADLVAVPSVHGPAGNVDGLPNTFLEGLASGTAVVASRVAGMLDVAADGKTAVLVREGDVEALATALAELLGDRIRRQQLGDAGRELARSQLSWERAAARFESIYAEALGR
jgi:glycosyltransferase involved in cell wall biosynthesis